VYNKLGYKRRGNVFVEPLPSSGKGLRSRRLTGWIYEFTFENDRGAMICIPNGSSLQKFDEEGYIDRQRENRRIRKFKTTGEVACSYYDMKEVQLHSSPTFALDPVDAQFHAMAPSSRISLAGRLHHGAGLGAVEKRERISSTRNRTLPIQPIALPTELSRLCRSQSKSHKVCYWRKLRRKMQLE
jgi:hypothetical protein